MVTPQLNFDTYDVFTSKRYQGNQLAIVHVPSTTNLTYSQKLRITQEFNYSETVFLHDLDGGAKIHEWRLDIFITSQEVAFAGHPTIGTACFLGEQFPSIRRATLITKAGRAEFQIEGEGGNKQASIAVPHNYRIHATTLGKSELLRMQPRLHSTQETLPETSPVISIVPGMTFVLIELVEGQLDQLTLNSIAPEELMTLDKDWQDGFIGSYFYHLEKNSSAGRPTLHCRMMGGVSFEDPATGSAASALACYLASKATNMPIELDVEQGVQMGRPSKITVTISMDKQKNIDHIKLCGRSVHVMKGSLTVPD